MNVTIESTGDLGRRMRVEIPEDRVETEVATRLKSLMKTAKIPGFRPGKVPMKVVERQYGRQVREEVVSEVVRSSLYDALIKENLRPANAPSIEPIEMSPGKGVAFTAEFEVYPEVKVAGVEALEIVRPTATVSDVEVDKMIETLRQQRKTWHDVERSAVVGDQIVIDFEGTVDGQPLEGGSGTGMNLELGAGKMIQGFEEGLVGASKDEARTLDLVFPEQYHATELAGKPVRFEVRVQAVQEAALPEVNDEFVSQFGVNEGGLGAFRVEVKQNMERELSETIKARLKQNVMEGLASANPLEVPQSLIDAEAAAMLQQQHRELQQQGVDTLGLNLDPAMYQDPAKKRVTLGLLLSELVKSNDLKADPEKVRSRIETIASTYETPEQVVNWYYADRERLSGIESAVLEDEIVEWVLQRAQVTEEATSFDALMNPRQTSKEA